MKDKTCCFVGHTPKSLPWGDDEYAPDCCEFKDRLFSEIEKMIQRGYQHFIIGMAQGFGIYAGEALILCRRIYPSITIEAAIPYPNQTKGWPKGARARYKSILSWCDKKTIVSGRYTPACMRTRNRYMAEQSSFLLTAWNGRTNEILNAINDALQNSVTVFNLTSLI